MVANVAALAANEDGTSWEGDTHYDTTWTGTKDGSISVGGLNPGDQVKFYRVLAYDQNAHTKVADLTATSDVTAGAGSWKVIAPFAAGTNAINGTELKAILSTGITAELAGKIAKNATGNADYTAVVPANGTVATQAAVEDGLYVAIVVPAEAGWVYNPIFVASDYYTTTGGDKSSTWTAAETPLSYSNGAMAKKTPITITKTAAEAAEAGNETDGAKAVGVGDVITYTINTTIPEFADNYTAPLFVISDKLSSGLTLTNPSDVAVSFSLAEGDTAPAYNITYPEGLSFKITFTSADLLNLSAATPVTVTYTASVTETAITNVNEEDNTVTLEYSHEPSVDDEGEGKKLRDKTHHYTFTIDGAITGDSQYHWTEVVKVGLDKDGNEIQQTKTLSSGKTVGALQGAEFKLYTDSGCNTEYNKGAYAAANRTTAGNKILSDENGRLYINGQEGISGLDAGEYWLREELAPAGYIKQQAAVHIEIIPTFFDEYVFTEEGFTITCDDVLQSYIVKIDGVQTAGYVLNYPAPVDGVYSTDEPTSVTGTDSSNKGDIVIGNAGPIVESHTGDTKAAEEAGKIKNTQGVELPSTGGMGTTLLYVGGSILVILAAILLITKRRMNAED